MSNSNNASESPLTVPPPLTSPTMNTPATDKPPALPVTAIGNKRLNLQAGEEDDASSLLLELPPELQVLIFKLLVECIDDEPFKEIDSKLLSPTCSFDRNFACTQAAMRGQRASWGSIMRGSAFACASARLHALISERKIQLRQDFNDANRIHGEKPLTPLNKHNIFHMNGRIPEDGRNLIGPKRACLTILIHLVENELLHKQFLLTQEWALRGAKSLAKASPSQPQLLALVRSRAARWTTLRRSLFTLHLSWPLRAECCRTYAPPKWPLVTAGEFNLKMRSILVDWLADVSRTHAGVDMHEIEIVNWPQQVLPLAILVLDFYMQVVGQQLPRSKLQLIGCAALHVAVIYESNPAGIPEAEAPWTRDIVARHMAAMTDDTYTHEQVLEVVDDMLSNQLMPSLTELAPATAYGWVVAVTGDPCNYVVDSWLQRLTTPEGDPLFGEDDYTQMYELWDATAVSRLAHYLCDLSLVWPGRPKPGEQSSFNGATVGAAAMLLATYILYSPLDPRKTYDPDVAGVGYHDPMDPTNNTNPDGYDDLKMENLKAKIRADCFRHLVKQLEKCLGQALTTLEPIVAYLSELLALEIIKMKPVIEEGAPMTDLPPGELTAVSQKHEDVLVKMTELLARLVKTHLPQEEAAASSSGGAGSSSGGGGGSSGAGSSTDAIELFDDFAAAGAAVAAAAVAAADNNTSGGGPSLLSADNSVGDDGPSSSSNDPIVNVHEDFATEPVRLLRELTVPFILGDTKATRRSNCTSSKDHVKKRVLQTLHASSDIEDGIRTTDGAGLFRMLHSLSNGAVQKEDYYDDSWVGHGGWDVDGLASDLQLYSQDLLGEQLTVVNPEEPSGSGGGGGPQLNGEEFNFTDHAAAAAAFLGPLPVAVVESEEEDNEEWIQDDGQSEASITDALSDSVCVGDEDGAESDDSEEY